MKIEIDKIDQSQFMVHPHVVNGEVCYLVQPCHIGAKWREDTLCFRSSLWNSDGELISAGFKKFFNWGEQPEVSPLPQSLKDSTIVEKVDGSLLIVSKYKGNYILRTRGTSDASKLDNGHELELFRETILPKLDKLMRGEDTWPESVLFEWVSPLQKIILNYGDQPEWYLVGSVKHSNYNLAQQIALDDAAASEGFKRPVSYTFPTLEELIKGVEEWKGKEGVVVYSNNGQTLHKVKSAWYLALHRMKEEFGSIERLIDVWFTWGCPDYQTTETKIVSQFDWELFQTIRGDLSRICDGWKEVAKIEQYFTTFIQENILPIGDPKDKKSRGQMAPKVLAAYGNTNRASYVFKLMDGRSIDQEDRKKLLYQVLKK